MYPNTDPLGPFFSFADHFVAHFDHFPAKHPKRSTFGYTGTLDWQVFVTLVIWCATEIKAFPKVVNIHCGTTVHSVISDRFVIWTDHDNVFRSDLFGPNFRYVSHLQRDNAHSNQLQIHTLRGSDQHLFPRHFRTAEFDIKVDSISLAESSLRRSILYPCFGFSKRALC